MSAEPDLSKPIEHYLHRLWGKAKDKPDYVKGEWGALQWHIEQLQRRLAKAEQAAQEQTA